MGGDDNCRMSETDALAYTFDGAVRLADWGVILAQGTDAASFLNSQLTQDMLHLGDTMAVPAGWCSPKGRLLATFVAWRVAPEQIALACSADLLPATLKRLSMFVLRAKCKLSDASAEWPLYGLAGPSAEALLGSSLPADDWAAGSHGAARVIRLPRADGITRFLWAGGAQPPSPPLPLQAWQWLEVRSALPRVVAATVDRFVPQMLNLELLGAVNFKKGCYPGQEVVARSQYRGTLKRRMYLVDSTAPLAPGAEVFHSADPGQPAGMVVLGASLPGGRHAALVELKIAAIDGGELRAAGADDARLTPAALPYPLDALVD
jgi:folate-binding protein YgfZ